MLTTFLSGILSILSPCVLPLIPVLMASSLTSTRRSFFMLLLGFVSSFTIIGIVVTLLSKSINFDPDFLRYAGAVLMVLMALAMIVPIFQSTLEKIGLALDGLSRRSTPAAMQRSAFFSGATLSLIWAPCSGPALGVALGWVAATDTLTKGIFYLGLFGLGAGLMLFLLGSLTRKLGHAVFQKYAVHLRALYKVSAVALLIVALSVFTNTDRRLQTWATENLPEWWLQILIRY